MAARSEIEEIPNKVYKHNSQSKTPKYNINWDLKVYRDVLTRNSIYCINIG